MIFGNGLKKFDFARRNLDGRAKCLAQKNEEKTAYNTVFTTHVKIAIYQFCILLLPREFHPYPT